MRGSILLGFWRLGKCRGRILRSLEGFTARWQAQGRAAADWEDPMAVGFLVTLVTRLAQRGTGHLGPDALGSPQAELWVCLTGLPSEPLGERLVTLSLAADPRFVEGSRRALLFAAALEAAGQGAPESPGHAGGDADLPLPCAHERQSLFDLWDSLLSDVPVA